MGGRSRSLVVTTPESPVVLDSVRRGEVDIWPIQRAEPGQLADEIARGEHDAYLSDLAHAERSQRSAAVVLAAIRARRTAAGLDPDPAVPSTEPPEPKPWKGFGS